MCFSEKREPFVVECFMKHFHDAVKEKEGSWKIGKVVDEGKVEKIVNFRGETKRARKNTSIKGNKVVSLSGS